MTSQFGLIKHIKDTPAIAAMHGPHSLFSVLTKQVNQPYSLTSEVLTKDTGVVRGLPIDVDQGISIMRKMQRYFKCEEYSKKIMLNTQDKYKSN